MSKAFTGDEEEGPEQILKINVQVIIEVEGAEMVNESIDFESQGEAQSKNWSAEVEKYISESIKNFNRPELD